jgi:hypothetical protein
MENKLEQMVVTHNGKNMGQRHQLATRKREILPYKMGRQ